MTAFNNIASRRDLADFLNMPHSKLTYILFVKGVDSYYFEFEIPKKTGDPRKICAPSGDLKTVQQKLADVLWDHQKSIYEEQGIKPNISHAFEEEKSIITNAKIHRNKRFVVNVDLNDFFGSIHIGRVCGFFEKNRYFKLPHEAAVTIAQLACYKGKLPQGAPTSPIITNLICQVLDMHLLSLAKRYKLDYTRYADDLTFSTNNKSFLEKWAEFYTELDRKIKKAGFSINERKTRIAYRDSKQVVTGLVVNKKISVDHSYYRKVRAMAHSLYKTGAYEVDGKEGTIKQLEGRFSFIDHIDKYNNECDFMGAHNSFNLSGREKQYQQFLFYRYFFAHEKPLIVTEGKTDVRYIKVALRSLYKEYPELIEKDSTGRFVYKVVFLKRTKRLRYFFNLSLDGADSMKNLYNFFSSNGKDKSRDYLAYFSKIAQHSPEKPVVLVFDNEIDNKSKPLYKFANHVRLSEEQKSQLSKDLFVSLIPNGNLFLLTNPLNNGDKEAEIESMFSFETRSVVLGGKTLSLASDFDVNKHYGKDHFSNYVLANYETIDFSGFRPFLDALKSVVVGYSKEDSNQK